MTTTILLIAAISIVSYIAFAQPAIMSRYQLNAWSVVHRKQFVRLISHGFLHADWFHLLVNMYVLYGFGEVVLYYFSIYLDGYTDFRFLLLFFTALPFSAIYSVYKNKSNPAYNAVGASGAVSAIVFTSIFFDPYNMLLLFFVIPVPGIVFGVLYLIYSAYMARKQVDNIGHDAHFWGAVYGLVFPLLYEPALIKVFIQKLISF